jgi:hypothetical protein
MLRRLMSVLLRADLEPGVAWPEDGSTGVVARVSVEVPRPWGRTETLEQVLCESEGGYILFKRWLDSGRLSRVRFGRALDGREMRLTEWRPAPRPVYRLQLCPVDGGAVAYASARRTWLRLWRSEAHGGLGAGLCFVDGEDRGALEGLRVRLLGGEAPEALRREEEMWRRMDGMAEPERRAALAALAMQSLREVDRRFEEMHPDHGPVPGGLKPLFDHVQGQIRKIEKTAASGPVDPELAELMRRFVADATRRGPPGPEDAGPGHDEPGRDRPGGGA